MYRAHYYNKASQHNNHHKPLLFIICFFLLCCCCCWCYSICLTWCQWEIKRKSLHYIETITQCITYMRGQQKKARSPIPCDNKHFKYFLIIWKFHPIRTSTNKIEICIISNACSNIMMTQKYGQNKYQFHSYIRNSYGMSATYNFYRNGDGLGNHFHISFECIPFNAELWTPTNQPGKKRRSFQFHSLFCSVHSYRIIFGHIVLYDKCILAFFNKALNTLFQNDIFGWMESTTTNPITK